MLEKALLVKEEQQRASVSGDRVLGGAAASEDIIGDDELWAHGLRAALEEEEETEEDDEDEEGAGDGNGIVGSRGAG